MYSYAAELHSPWNALPSDEKRGVDQQCPLAPVLMSDLIAKEYYQGAKGSVVNTKHLDDYSKSTASYRKAAE